MKMRDLALALALAGGLPAAAAAAEAELPVPIQSYEGIRYYSAGVGIDERAALPQRFPLKVVFSTDKRNLLCDAAVTISSGGKTVFQSRAENGPWLIVDLPPGTYDVVAVQDGAAKSAKSVKLAAGRKKTVVLRWKTTEVDMGL
jgi:hypothetical protein